MDLRVDLMVDSKGQNLKWLLSKGAVRPWLWGESSLTCAVALNTRNENIRGSRFVS